MGLAERAAGADRETPLSPPPSSPPGTIAVPASPLTIADAKTGSSATVLPHLGFNCFSWRPQLKLPDGAETREMLWAESGFDAADKKPSRSGVPLLFPFPGRIRGGVFEFEGKRHEVSDRADGLGNAIHGFAIDAVWRVVDRADDVAGVLLAATGRLLATRSDGKGRWRRLRKAGRLGKYRTC